jgi:tripartite ATP-independent transporter DctM subunit
MDPQALILVIAFVTLLLLSMPVAFAIGIATFLAVMSIGQVPAPLQVSRVMAAGIDSFPLLAIPFFIVAGELMSSGGMARRLLSFAEALVGGLRGGLAYVNTVTCMMFGAISGSSAAAVSSVGGIMIPQMRRAGYGTNFAVALTGTSATTGLVIPPSNTMIVYAIVAQNVSIAAIFLAGVLPGILMGVLIMVASYFILRGKDLARTQLHGQTQARVNIFFEALRATPSLLLIVIVLGGILGGAFSATEAAAIAVAYAWLLGCVIYRELPLREVPQLLLRSAKTTGIVFFLIAASQAMAWVLTRQQIPQTVAEAMISISRSPIVLLMIINLTLLAVGTFLDMTPAVLIFTPIFLPVALQMGMDPTHFGIVMIMNLCIGLCTPPVGTILFIACGVGKTSIEQASRAMIPFWVAMLGALLVVTYVPKISLWLPTLWGLIK